MKKGIVPGVLSLHQEMKEWMAHLHQHPEVSTHESATRQYIADELRKIGCTVYDPIGKEGICGIVAELRNGSSSKVIGIRADFDALPIQEENDLPYKSLVEGVSHLCGHDGHTAMALGAAKYLAKTKHFDGTVRFIFQPAEETMQGGPSMIADRLFEQYPVDAVFALHNIPGLEEGKLYFHEGETMSAVDNWEIELKGVGSHGSMPELSIDPVVAGASLVMALQTIVSRNVSPWDNSVVTIGAFLAGNAGNVIANSALLRISVRNMQEGTREKVLDRIREITSAQAKSYGCTYEIREGIPGAVLVNSKEATAFIADVAAKQFGKENVIYPCMPMMSSEDFAFMLQKVPGCYVMLGNGEGPMVHHPQYCFNPEILPVGASLWVALVEAYLQ